MWPWFLALFLGLHHVSTILRFDTRSVKPHLLSIPEWHEFENKQHISIMGSGLGKRGCYELAYLTCCGDSVIAVWHKVAEVGFTWVVKVITHCSKKEMKERSGFINTKTFFLPPFPSINTKTSYPPPPLPIIKSVLILKIQFTTVRFWMVMLTYFTLITGSPKRSIDPIFVSLWNQKRKSWKKYSNT